MGYFKKGAIALACAMSFFTSTVHAAKNEINVFYFTLNDLFLSQLSVELQNTAISKRIRLRQHDANVDSKTQIEQVKKVLETQGNHHPILVNPVDTETAHVLLELAKDHDTPIIFFNRNPDMTNFSSFDKAWFVSSNAQDAGKIQAQIVISYLTNHPDADKNKDGKINYLIFQGDPAHHDTAIRTNSFINTMRDSQYKLKAIDSVYAHWDAAKAQSKMTYIMNSLSPESIELIVSNNDAMALGVIHALYKFGYNIPRGVNVPEANNSNPKAMRATMPKVPYIPVVGIDALPEAIDAVERGTMLGSVYNDANAVADVAMRIANLYLNDIPITYERIGYPVDDRIIDIPYVRVCRCQ